MTEREQIKKPTTTRTDEEVVEEAPAGAKQGEKIKAIKAELDELLDEIDEVLEENAEEFVQAYVQKGGE
jgi:prokaryotic ubiquitin-like protein Pup